MKIPKVLILVIILAFISVPASAERRMQGPAGDGPREEGEFAPDQGPGGAPSEERREEIRKKIDAIRVWRMTEALKLDADTAAKLASALSPVEQKRRDTMREQAETMKTLRQALRPQKPDEATIRQLLDKLEKNHNSMQELRSAEIKSVKNILTVEQQARFLIFQHEFHREVRQMIEGARGRGNERPGPGRSGAEKTPQF